MVIKSAMNVVLLETKKDGQTKEQSSLLVIVTTYKHNEILY